MKYFSSLHVIDQKLIKIFLVGHGQKWCGQFGLWTLKLTVSSEWIDKHGQKLCDILKLSKFSSFFLKNKTIFEQKAEWTWSSSCHYILSFRKAWSSNFFKKRVLILWLLRKICCSPWLVIKNTIEKLLKLFEWARSLMVTLNFGQ